MTTGIPRPDSEGRPTFARLLRAEWTKLRSVPRWMLALPAAVAVTILAATLLASGYHVDDEDDGPQYAPNADFRDEGHFVHLELQGDGELSVRVADLRAEHEWAKAGLMIRSDGEPGSSYAAVMATAEHGVHLQADFAPESFGHAAQEAPGWLRLARSGTTVTAWQSADGEDWHSVGTVELPELDDAAQIGLFVAAPDRVELGRAFGGETISAHGTTAEADFAQIVHDGDPVAPTDWRERERSASHGRTAVFNGGTVTIAADGDVGHYAYADDPTAGVLSGLLTAMVVLIALAVVSVTSEYRRGTIRTTFLAVPHRRWALLAKALVLGCAAFATGLAAALGALLASGPILRSNDFAVVTLTDPVALRVAVGSAALLAAVAVLSLGVAVLVRRAAPAISGVLVIMLVPQLTATGLPLAGAQWLERLTPAAGFAVQETVQRYDTAIAPWAGLGVLCGYAVIALGLALWRVEEQEP